MHACFPQAGTFDEGTSGQGGMQPTPQGPIREVQVQVEEEVVAREIHKIVQHNKDIHSFRATRRRTNVAARQPPYEHNGHRLHKMKADPRNHQNKDHSQAVPSTSYTIGGAEGGGGKEND